jgi:enoyl-[acyl-carrier-protein] reductase (NADH)
LRAPATKASAGGTDLSGKKGMLMGTSNAQSIGAGCAKALPQTRATLAANYLDANTEPYVRSVTQVLDGASRAPGDVQDPGELEDGVRRIRDGATTVTAPGARGGDAGVE